MGKLNLVTFGHVPPFCGFCGRNHEDADIMLGPKPFICDRCVATCVDVMSNKLPRDAVSMVEIIKSVA